MAFYASKNAYCQLKKLAHKTGVSTQPKDYCCSIESLCNNPADTGLWGFNIFWASQPALSFYAKRQKRVRRRIAPSHKRCDLAAKNQLHGGGERKVDTLPAGFGTGAAGGMLCRGEGAFARPCPLAQRRAVFPAGRQAGTQRLWYQRIRVRRDSPECASIVRPMSLGAWIGWKQSGRQQVNAQVTPRLCANTFEVLKYRG